MSSIPSIRVECAQCKQSFWVKLKKGTIPSVVVACPNSAYAWDLSKLSSDNIVRRSFKWDEFLKRVTLLLQPKKAVADVSEEVFREAGESGDTDRSIMELPDLVLEPVTEVTDLGATSSEAIREPNSGSIRRPVYEDQSLELLALQSLEEPVPPAAIPKPVKSKETARYPSIPTSPMAERISVAKPQESEVSVVDEVEEAMLEAFLELDEETLMIPRLPPSTPPQTPPSRPTGPSSEDEEPFE